MSQQARVHGRRWWTALVVAGALVALAAAAAGVLLQSLSWFNVSWTAGALCALAGMLAARGRAEASERARWTWWAAAAAAWLAGQLAWDVFGVVGAPPSPHVADLGWWAFAVLVVAGLLRTHDGSRGARLVAVVEVVPLVAAAMALTFAELWDAAAASPLPAAARVAALVYPALYVSAAVITLQAMVGGSLRRVHGHGARLVLVGIVAQAVAFVGWASELLDGRAGSQPSDALWLLGMLATGAGGTVAARSGRAAEERGDRFAARGGVLPAAVFLLLLAALVRAGFEGPSLGAHLMIAVGLLICGATLIARGLLLSRRLHVLLARERLARRDLAGREAELAQLNEQLRQDVRRDPLTGLRNRRALAEDLPALEALAHRHGEVFAVVLCDVDRFKAYNDHLGHLAGDHALRLLAATVRGVLRAGDVAYRYGGEEIVLVLRSTTAAEARVAAERVRAAVMAAALPHPADPTGVVTVSVGVAAGATDGATLLARADAALYRAKRGGRNRVVAAGAEDVDAALSSAGALDEPGARRLGGMLAVVRAAAAGGGALTVLEAVAQTIRTELRFQTVAANLRDGELIRTVLVEGDEEARTTLLGNEAPWSVWEPALGPEHQRCGAVWMPAGAFEWDPGVVAWTPARNATLDAQAWDPEDELLLPLRSSTGEVLGVISVDEPLSGRRPEDGEISALMAVADHAGLVLELLERPAGPAAGAVDGSERLAAVMLLAETLDLRDAGTAEHSRTVGAYARATAAALGFAPEAVERVHAAGVLHDLGKLGVADAILHKPSALTDAEWREIRRHPEVGARILEHAGLGDIAGWVRAHHERLDGRGYPVGLRAAEIPLEARILAVADAYEAMVADRPYRAGMAPADARAELLRCAGTQFDHGVVDAFLRVGAADAAEPAAAAA